MFGLGVCSFPKEQLLGGKMHTIRHPEGFLLCQQIWKNKDYLQAANFLLAEGHIFEVLQPNSWVQPFYHNKSIQPFQNELFLSTIKLLRIILCSTHNESGFPLVQQWIIPLCPPGPVKYLTMYFYIHCPGFKYSRRNKKMIKNSLPLCCWGTL